MYSNLDKALNQFGNETIRLSRRNLNLTGFAKRGRKINNSKDLSKGLGYKITQKGTAYIIEFTSRVDYAAFMDEGVNGLQVNHNAPFSFKKKFANIGAIIKYIKSPKIKLRKTFINKAGQKVSQLVPKNRENIKSAAFVMARSIARNGIKPTKFFSKAIDEAFAKLPKQLEEALVKDLEDILFQDFQNNPNLKITQS